MGIKERTKSDAEHLHEGAKNILAAVQGYKDVSQFKELDQAAKALVRGLGSLVIDEISGENTTED